MLAQLASVPFKICISGECLITEGADIITLIHDDNLVNDQLQEYSKLQQCVKLLFGTSACLKWLIVSLYKDFPPFIGQNNPLKYPKYFLHYLHCTFSTRCKKRCSAPVQCTGAFALLKKYFRGRVAIRLQPLMRNSKDNFEIQLDI